MIRLLKLIKSLLELRFVIFNKILFNHKKISFTTFPLIRGKINIFGLGKIYIGKGVKINSSPNANPIGGDTRTVLKVDRDAVLRIGDYTGISNCTIVCFNEIIIGNHVKIGGSVKIYDTDFHDLNYAKRKNLETDHGNTKAVIIGNDCFIGAHSIILKGVTIGEKSIVGAGSVVTKSIPSHQIWGGNPAKFIKNLN
jgi:acetyltransferase-like isoleucine patch superfamily enzyme